MKVKAAIFQELLLSYIPEDNKKAHDMCARVYKKMVRDQLTDLEMSKQICSALHDGLYHGNWPWLIEGWYVD